LAGFQLIIIGRFWVIAEVAGIAWIFDPEGAIRDGGMHGTSLETLSKIWPYMDELRERISDDETLGHIRLQGQSDKKL
jgi:hypothetical protein